MQEYRILYVHGMGGGSDSRIPSLLNEHLGEYAPGDVKVSVIVRTYPFDPETAAELIETWVEEIGPALVIGESLGALHALRIGGCPHILVSPALNAPLYMGYLAWLALVPGVTAWLDRHFRPREGDRQSLHFTFRTLRKYRHHRREALSCAVGQDGSARAADCSFFAFFGEYDHYRKSGIVSVRTWKRYFGNNMAIYPGTHFMEEEFIISMLIPKILSTLDLPCMPRRHFSSASAAAVKRFHGFCNHERASAYVNHRLFSVCAQSVGEFQCAADGFGH